LYMYMCIMYKDLRILRWDIVIYPHNIDDINMFLSLVRPSIFLRQTHMFLHREPPWLCFPRRPAYPVPR
jgi:hypothetical protein